MAGVSHPLILLLLLSIIARGGCNFLGSDDNCIEKCVNIMQRNQQMEHLSYPSMRRKEGYGMTEKSFRAICEAYEEVDRCLMECESHNDQAAKIRTQTYAGIRYICMEKKKEFFKTLPCLSSHEEKAMDQCSSQIKDSLEASTAFSNTVINKESHQLRTRFEALCQSLGNTVSCIEPITRNSCGEEAADMMMKFIKVGFGSFEQIYSQLGISDQLPTSCRTLLSQSRPSKMLRRIANQSSNISPLITLIISAIMSLFR